jgi:cytochrome c-type biogenesis protein CcmH/NrfG
MMILAAQAQTAEEFEKRGLAHFREAYYKAIPQGEKARADIEFSLAEKAFLEAIRKRPDRVEPYLHLGRTYFVQKEYAKAARVYRKALDRAPEQKETYLQLASALEMAGDYEGAIDILKRLRQEETDERSVQILDGFISQLEKRSQEAGGTPSEGTKEP